MKNLFLLTFCSILLFSCSSDDGDGGDNSDCKVAFSDQDASGKFANVNFTIGSGSLKIISGKPFFSLFLETIPGDVCGFPDIDQSVLFGSGIPELKVGLYTLNNLTTVSFNTKTTDGADIQLATCGKIEILEITDTTVTGRIVAEADSMNTINGNFSAQLCEN